VIITDPARMKLLRNSRGRAGSSRVNAVSQPSRVNGCGMSVSRTASGIVLNEVMTVQANGTNISSA
jgi:hypothetical protein